jgi:hypothetical protein
MADQKKDQNAIRIEGNMMVMPIKQAGVHAMGYDLQLPLVTVKNRDTGAVTAFDENDDTTKAALGTTSVSDPIEITPVRLQSHMQYVASKSFGDGALFGSLIGIVGGLLIAALIRFSRS